VRKQIDKMNKKPNKLLFLSLTYVFYHVAMGPAAHARSRTFMRKRWSSAASSMGLF